MEIEIGGTYVFQYSAYPPRLVFVVEELQMTSYSDKLKAPYNYKVMSVHTGDYPLYAYAQELKPMWYETEEWNV